MKHRMMKKMSAAILMGILTMALPIAAKADDEIVIRFSNTWTQGTALLEYTTAINESFMEEHPNVRLEVDSQPTADLRTKLTVQAASGDLPDISWVPQSYAREFIKDGLIINWADIVNEDPDWKEWYSDAVWEGLTEPDGQIPQVPLEGAMDALYYNKEMFDENGWTMATTWDEFIELIGQIKEAGITPLVTGGKDNRFAWMASAFLARAAGLDNFRNLCFGEAMTSWDDPQYGFVEAVTKFKEMVDAGAFPMGVLGMSATEADQMFANGEAAMYYEGAWKVGNFESAGGEGWTDCVARADWPAFTDCPDGNPNTRVGGSFIGLFVKAGLDEEKQALCIELVKRYASPEFQVPQQERGGNVSAAIIEYDKDNTIPLMNQLVEAFRSAESFIPSMDGIAPPAVDLAIKATAFPGIITGEFDVDQAVAEVQKAAEDYAAGLS